MLDRVDDLHGVVADAACSQLADAYLLKDVVPWGDAVRSLGGQRDVREARAGTPLERMLARVEPLVFKLAADCHVYLWFVDDYRCGGEPRTRTARPGLGVPSARRVSRRSVREALVDQKIVVVLIGLASS